MTFVTLTFDGPCEEAYRGGRRYDITEVKGVKYLVGEGLEVLRIVRENWDRGLVTAVPIKNQRTLDRILEGYGNIGSEIEPDSN